MMGSRKETKFCCAFAPSFRRLRSVLKTKFNVIFSGEGKEIVRLADAIVDALRRDYRTADAAAIATSSRHLSSSSRATRHVSGFRL